MRFLDIGIGNGLDFRQPAILSKAYLTTQHRLFAYLNWPEDAAARDRFLAKVCAHYIGQLETWRNTVVGAPIPAIEFTTALQESVEGEMLVLGGFAAVTGGKSLDEIRAECHKQEKFQYAAGLVLLHVDIMARESPSAGPSIGKAVKLTSRVTEMSPSAVWDAWSKYSSVAHLAAGRLPFRNDPNARIFQLGTILAHAKYFQVFALTYRPNAKRAGMEQQTVIDPAILWRIPNGWLIQPFVPSSSIGMPSYVDDELRNYRAKERKKS